MATKKISELRPNMRKVVLEAVEVTEVSDSKEYSRMGRPGKVGSALIKDDTGSASLTLWNEQCDEIKTGDKLKIDGLKTSEWQGNLQLSTEFSGKITKL